MSGEFLKEIIAAQRKLSVFFAVFVLISAPILYLCLPYLPWQVNRNAVLLIIAVFSVFIIINRVFIPRKFALQIEIAEEIANILVIFSISVVTGFIRSPFNIAYPLQITYPFFLINRAFGLFISFITLLFIALETILPVWRELALGNFEPLVANIPFFLVYSFFIVFGVFTLLALSGTLKRIEQKRVQEQERTNYLLQTVKDLRQLEKEKIQFIQLIAHHFRTPLSRVKWTCESFIKGEQGKLALLQKRGLEEIRSHNNDLISLLDEILNISEWELRKINFEKSVNLSEVLEKQIEILRREAEKKKIKIITDLPRNILIEANREGIERVLNIILENALLYNKEHGKIDVSVGKKDKGIVLSIKDTGIGVPPEEQKYLFEVFFRASNAKMMNGQRKGISLFLAQEIIRAHLGSIHINSILNKGAEVIVRLPYAQEERV